MTRAAFIAAAAALMSLGAARADQVAVEAKAVVEKKDAVPKKLVGQLGAEQIKELVRVGVEKEADSQRQLFMGLMAMQIDELRRSSGFTEAQAKRLTIAAKGAVDRFTDRWQAATEKYVGQYASRLRGNRSKSSMEQLIRQYAANVNVAGLSMGVSPKIVVGAIAREPVWTKSLATVASDEQRKHLQDVAGHRDTLRRKACVEYCLSLVDRDLVLNDGQRKKLRDVIAKTLESKNLDLVNPRYESLHLMATVYKVPQESVQSILNQYQLTIWKNQAKRISRYGSMGVSRPGGPWAELLKPAVPKKTAAPKTKE